MSDELDVLRHDHVVIEPDPQFRAELMDRLRHHMVSGSDLAPKPLTTPTLAPDTAAQDTLPPPVQIEYAASDGPRQRGRRWQAAVAAAAVFVVAVGVAVVQNRDRDPELNTSSGPTQVFTEILPGSTVSLPPSPIPRARPGERTPSTLVWSGSELIVWSAVDGSSAGIGAAFELATGTWRTIAEAPIEFRPFATVTWTGTEVFVWGGQVDDAQGLPISAVDGAAYNPTTDTWRRLPDAPIEGAQGCCALWTGDEVVVLGAGPDLYGMDASGHPGQPGRQTAAYNPETDEWRRLADAPADLMGDTLWTGETILSLAGVIPEATDEPWSLLRYDLSADEWQIVDEDAGYTSLIPVTDGDGEVRTVLALPTETGAPVAILDRAGDAIGTLPAFPGDRATFGDEIAANGFWMGEEALFWISRLGSAQRAEDVWALNPSTQAWRQLDANEVPASPPIEPNEALSTFGSGDSLELVPDAGVLVGDGIVYRPPEPGG
jgi:hypothetical protein